MAGLSRFDFYPRDWISGTRELSDRARGVYIDLLCRMYDLGRALDYDERELCRFLGYRDNRQLRPVIDELMTKGKIVLADGKLSNCRAVREIEAAHERIAIGARGGRPRKNVAEPTAENATRTAPAGDQRPTSDRSQGRCFQQDHRGNNNPPSPSPPPPKKKEKREGGATAPAGGNYAFSGQVIRLTETDFTKWAATYSAIPDMRAELVGLDAWCHREHPPGSPKRKDWFFIVQNALNKKHQRFMAERAAGAGNSRSADVIAETDALYRQLGVS